jgi:hypothetical protein
VDDAEGALGVNAEFAGRSAIQHDAEDATRAAIDVLEIVSIDQSLGQLHGASVASWQRYEVRLATYKSTIEGHDSTCKGARSVDVQSGSQRIASGSVKSIVQCGN